MTLGSWDEGGRDETQREVTGWKLRVWSVRGEDQLLVLRERVLQRTGLPPSPSSSSAVPSSLGSINEVQGYTTDPKSKRWKLIQICPTSVRISLRLRLIQPLVM